MHIAVSMGRSRASGPRSRKKTAVVCVVNTNIVVKNDAPRKFGPIISNRNDMMCVNIDWAVCAISFDQARCQRL
jgi:hypothetical protein